MSNSGSATGGGSYVPPHKRAGQHPHPPQQQQQQQQQPTRPKAGPAQANKKREDHSPPPRRGGGGGSGRGGGGRGGRHHHGSSNSNSNSNSPKQQHQKKQLQPHAHNNSDNHHHPLPVNKEHHQQQVKLFRESLTRICCINLERRPDRWKSFQQHWQQSLGRKDGHNLLQLKIEQFAAIDGIPGIANDTNDTTTVVKDNEEDNHHNNNLEDENHKDSTTEEFDNQAVADTQDDAGETKIVNEEEQKQQQQKQQQEDLELLASAVKTTWDATENAKWDRHIEPPMAKEMSAGEVGCALSHVKLWRELVQTAALKKAQVLAAKEQHDTTAKHVQVQVDPDPLLPPPPPPEEIPVTMLILEDDALFYSPRLAHVGAPTNFSSQNNNTNNQNQKGSGGGQGKQQQEQQQQHYHAPPNHDFWTAFQLAWTQLPGDWDIWYLGFSDRGERIPVDDFHMSKPHHHHHHHGDHHHHNSTAPTMSIQIFRPTYGFHTHAYVLTAKAAQRLLDNLPVQGPLDVWLADNQWFGLRVYCSVIENEGWHNTGAWLVTQNRKLFGSNNNNNTNTNNHHNNNTSNNNNQKNNPKTPNINSDIGQSGRKASPKAEH